MENTYHPSADTQEEEDDLLATIRQMVSDEASRPMAAAPPFPGTDAEPSEPSAAPPEPPRPAATPLVLSAMARVTRQPAQAVPDAALRGMVADIVREELELALGGTLEGRVRAIVRRELMGLLDKARSAPPQG